MIHHVSSWNMSMAADSLEKKLHFRCVRRVDAQLTTPFFKQTTSARLASIVLSSHACLSGAVRIFPPSLLA